MLYRILIASLSFVFLKPVNAYLQNLAATNLEIINKSLGEVFDKWQDLINLKGKEKTYLIKVNGTDDDAEFFLSALKQRFRDYNFVYQISNDSIAVFEFTFVDISLNYTQINQSNILGNKLVLRQIAVETKLSYIEPDFNGVETFHFNSEQQDEFPLKDYDYIEDTSLSFAHAELPQESFIDRIIFPALLVAISAATVILFFIIRTK